MIVIGFGANEDSRFGQPAATFERAYDALSEQNIQILQKSSLWATSPVGDNSGDRLFINAIISVTTNLQPQELMSTLLNIEQEFGRKRSYQNAPRGIDLDLIVYNGQVIQADDLTLPHPRMDSRGFVLWPLQEIAPDFIHPVSQKPISALISELADDQKGEIYEG